MNDYEKTMIDELWKYPLFEAFARRRATRYPLGCELKNAPYSFSSAKDPVPLSELEQAILCWAGHGINGAIVGEIDVTCNTFNSWWGRTHPNPCNDLKQDLMFFDDNGVYLYRPQPPKAHAEFQVAEDRAKILTQFKEGVIKIQDGRPDFHESGLMKINQWNANKPGTTTFMPVVDIVYEYINFMFMAFGDDGWQIIDDKTGKSAGVQKWVDSGFLNGPTVPLSMLEISVSNLCTATTHYMLQNVGLAVAGMGLNGYVYGGFVPLVLLGGTPFSRGLGFRFITGKDKMPTPVGKDGFIEPFCPPYVKNTDEAVDKVFEDKFGPTGPYGADYKGVIPWKDRSMVTKVERPNEETREVTKAFLRYLYENYGRFPALVDAIATPSAYTAHHADLDFYKQYYPEEFITEQIKNHMKIWHGQD